MRTPLFQDRQGFPSERIAFQPKTDVPMDERILEANDPKLNLEQLVRDRGRFRLLDFVGWLSTWNGSLSNDCR